MNVWICGLASSSGETSRVGSRSTGWPTWTIGADGHGVPSRIGMRTPRSAATSTARS